MLAGVAVVHADDVALAGLLDADHLDRGVVDVLDALRERLRGGHGREVALHVAPGGGLRRRHARMIPRLTS